MDRIKRTSLISSRTNAIKADHRRGHFGSDETTIHLGILNHGRKVLGFGAEGVGIVVHSNGEKFTKPCKGLRIGYAEDNLHSRVMVDSFQELSAVAVFDSFKPPIDLLDILIQANRVAAAPYVFQMSFSKSDLESQTQ